MNIKILTLLLLIFILAIVIGWFLGKKTRNTETAKKINENFKNANSKGTKIIIGKPFELSQFYDQRLNNEILEEASKIIAEKIEELK